MKLTLHLEGKQLAYTREPASPYERNIEAAYQRGYRAGLRGDTIALVPPYQRVDYRDAWQHGVNDATRHLQGKPLYRRGKAS